jgi:hypothetical protein
MSAAEGPLAAMKALNSKSPQVDKLREGPKQRAIRGKGRNFDEHGVLDIRRLFVQVTTEQYERLIANAQQLFPSAEIATEAGVHTSTEDTYAEKLVRILSNTLNSPGCPSGRLKQKIKEGCKRKLQRKLQTAFLNISQDSPETPVEVADLKVVHRSLREARRRL